jgi:hypothetical protein
MSDQILARGRCRGFGEGHGFRAGCSPVDINEMVGGGDVVQQELGAVIALSSHKSGAARCSGARMPGRGKRGDVQRRRLRKMCPAWETGHEWDKGLTADRAAATERAGYA